MTLEQELYEAKKRIKELESSLRLSDSLYTEEMVTRKQLTRENDFLRTRVAELCRKVEDKSCVQAEKRIPRWLSRWR